MFSLVGFGTIQAMVDESVFMQLGGVSAELISDDSQIHRWWQLQFGDFLQDQASEPVSLRIKMHNVTELPARPAYAPFYVDQRLDLYGQQHSILEAFQAENESLILHFFDGGLVYLSPETGSADVWVTPAVFPSGRFEDVTLVALQVLLRAHGAYMIHASGVSNADGAILFVGGSGSGKTTTCLNLLLHGWRMLANDVVLIKRQGDQIIAWPVPDTVTLRPKTDTLLPKLRPFIENPYTVDGEILPLNMLPAHQLVQGDWSPPTLVRAICFPTIAQQAETTVTAQMRAIALALLMQESVDRWDQAALSGHSDMLHAVCQQAACFSVQLGFDMVEQRRVLANLLTQTA